MRGKCSKEFQSSLSGSDKKAATICLIECTRGIALFFQAIKDARQFTWVHSRHGLGDFLHHERSASREERDDVRLFGRTQGLILKMLRRATQCIIQKEHKSSTARVCDESRSCSISVSFLCQSIRRQKHSVVLIIAF